MLLFSVRKVTDLSAFTIKIKSVVIFSAISRRHHRCFTKSVPRSPQKRHNRARFRRSISRRVAKRFGTLAFSSRFFFIPRRVAKRFGTLAFSSPLCFFLENNIPTALYPKSSRLSLQNRVPLDILCLFISPQKDIKSSKSKRLILYIFNKSGVVSFILSH